MALIAIRMEQADLEQLKKEAAEERVPFTIYARMLIIRGMKEKTDLHELTSH